MKQAAYKPGDVVKLSDRLNAPRWWVVAEDTGRTPCHDPEPAYRLRKLDGSKAGEERYAYESDLTPVEHPA